MYFKIIDVGVPAMKLLKGGNNELAKVRYLGSLGIFLIMLFWIPKLGIFLFILGNILFLLAIKTIEEIYYNISIYHRSLYAFGISMFSLITGIASLLISVAAIANHNKYLLISSVVIIAISYILWIIGGYYYRDVFLTLYSVFNFDSFKWAGNLIFIGYIALVFSIGIIAIFIGLLCALLGFLSINIENEKNMRNESQRIPNNDKRIPNLV